MSTMEGACSISSGAHYPEEGRKNNRDPETWSSIGPQGLIRSDIQDIVVDSGHTKR